MDQICAEYKVKALQCHPDKHPDDPLAGNTYVASFMHAPTCADVRMHMHTLNSCILVEHVETLYIGASGLKGLKWQLRLKMDRSTTGYFTERRIFWP